MYPRDHTKSQKYTDIANSSVVCSDTKQSPFSAVLKDSSSGYTLSIIAMNNEDGGR
jgi:hypothetical protein